MQSREGHKIVYQKVIGETSLQDGFEDCASDFRIRDQRSTVVIEEMMVQLQVQD